MVPPVDAGHRISIVWSKTRRFLLLVPWTIQSRRATTIWLTNSYSWSQYKRWEVRAVWGGYQYYSRSVNKLKLLSLRKPIITLTLIIWPLAYPFLRSTSFNSKRLIKPLPRMWNYQKWVARQILKDLSYCQTKNVGNITQKKACFPVFNHGTQCQTWSTLDEPMKARWKFV